MAQIDESRRAMATWLGTLARGGVVSEEHAKAGIAVAAYVVGEGRLNELREWLSTAAPEVQEREQTAAIEVCIWMAHADREVDAEERWMLKQIIEAAELDEGARDHMIQQSQEAPSLARLDKRVTHPVLRELLMALAWELAASDGRIMRAELDFYDGLAKRLGIDPDRAVAIRAAITDRVG